MEIAKIRPMIAVVISFFWWGCGMGQNASDKIYNAEKAKLAVEACDEMANCLQACSDQACAEKCVETGQNNGCEIADLFVAPVLPEECAGLFECLHDCGFDANCARACITDAEEAGCEFLHPPELPEECNGLGACLEQCPHDGTGKECVEACIDQAHANGCNIPDLPDIPQLPEECEGLVACLEQCPQDATGFGCVDACIAEAQANGCDIPVLPEIPEACKEVFFCLEGCGADWECALRCFDNAPEECKP